MFRTAAARLLALLALVPASASALELTPSEALVVDFRIDRPSPEFLPFGPYDVLALTFPAGFSPLGVTGQKAELFDGGTLLGVHRTSSATGYHYWKAPGVRLRCRRCSGGQFQRVADRDHCRSDSADN